MEKMVVTQLGLFNKSFESQRPWQQEGNICKISHMTFMIGGRGNWDPQVHKTLMRKWKIILDLTIHISFLHLDTLPPQI